MSKLYSKRYLPRFNNKHRNIMYKFTCFTKDTKDGFQHLCYVGDITSATGYKPIATQGWCNRTWEEHPYDTVVAKAIEILDDAIVTFNPET